MKNSSFSTVQLFQLIIIIETENQKNRDESFIPIAMRYTNIHEWKRK